MEVIGLTVAVFPLLWIGLFTHEAAIVETGSLYFKIVAPAYAASGIVFTLTFAAQGSGHMRWVFLAATARLLIAAGGGWIAVAIFGASITSLFAILASASIVGATICIVAERSGAMWPRADRHKGVGATIAR